MFDGFFDQYSIANGYYDPALDEEDEGALSPKQQRQRRARMIQNPDAAVMPPSLAMGSPPLGLPPMPNNTTPGIVAGAGQPPVIGTPKGPAVMTSPTSAAILPDVIPRREGVTLNDKMRGIYATMGAMGTPTFNSQYADIQDRLLQKDLEDDAFNQKMDLLTLPSYEIDKATGNMVTKPAQYVKTQDGWKLNSDTKPTFKEGDSALGSGLSGLTSEQRALIKNSKGDNADTMLGFFLGQNAGIVPKDMTFETFVSSPLNANQGETSKSFNRNTSIFSDNGFTDGQSRSLAMLAENGGLEIIKNPDTGEITAFDPVTRETFVIEDYETGLKKIVEAQSSLQSSEDELGQFDSIVTQSRTVLDDNDKVYGEQRRGIRVLDRWEKKINEMSDEEFDDIFGWGNQLMYDFFGKGHPDLAALNSVTTYEALQALANEANLAPVSNMEFTKVGGLLGSGKLESKEQLLALFEEARFRTDDKIQRIMLENKYHLNRLNQVPNKTWYNMYSERPYMTEAQTLKAAKKGQGNE
jgi:uncharacterized protein YjhX (UPF0386 family)